MSLEFSMSLEFLLSVEFTSAVRGRLCSGQPSQEDEETRARLGQWVFGIFYLMSFLFDCKTTMEKRFVLLAYILLIPLSQCIIFTTQTHNQRSFSIWSVLRRLTLAQLRAVSPTRCTLGTGGSTRPLKLMSSTRVDYVLRILIIACRVVNLLRPLCGFVCIS